MRLVPNWGPKSLYGMASPMREKRAWSTRESDAESKETAAFEATVAVAKDTVAKSGAFLSTANEDLIDHKRWLQAQSAAVERDRARHERWLQRQREHRLAVARRERTRRRRQLMRQRAMRAIQQALWASALFVKSLVLFIVAKTVAGVKYLAVSIARGAAWLGARLCAFALYVARLVAAVARWTAAKLGAFAGWTGRQLSAGFRWSSAKTRASARVTGRALAAGSSFAVAKAGVAGRSAGRSLGSGFAIASAKGAALAGASGRSASRGLALLGAQASSLGRAGKRQLGAGFAWSKTKAQAFAPVLYVRVARLGRQAERYARAGAARAEGLFERAKIAAPGAAGAEAQTSQAPAVEIYGPFYEGFWVDGVSPNDPHAPVPEIVAPRVETENALSSWALPSWARTRDVDLSQMMIIAGAVLLVCGGLLLGGGLLLRSGALQAHEEAPHAISWSFEDPDRPLPERAVFTLSGTPASFRINGLSIGGKNLSDLPLTSVRGVLKPNVQRPDLKLALQVNPRAVAAASEDDTEGQALEVVPENTVPPHTPFRLVFSFPPEAMNGEDGMTVEEFFESYGGLMLNLHYEIDGKQRALIQYLPPDMLRAQLTDVVAEGGGS
jgi:hypothetical protein